MNLFYTFTRWSLKRKLMLIMMTTSCTAIILMALLVIVNQAVNSQRAIQQQLITLADVLGSRSTGALTFDDSDTAIEILDALALKSNIIYAVIERANGNYFASFGDIPEYNANHTNEFLALLQSILLANEIHVVRDIYLEKERIGSIRIVSNLDELQGDVLNYMFLVAMISITCIAITFFICTRLQKLVSQPILNLQKAMDSVSENKDYSLRVANAEENELGALVDGFNQMLQQIQIRDTWLAEHSHRLEKTVKTRGIQLTDANEKRILWLESMARFLKHELKNSSVGIKTSLDLIERHNTEKDKVDVYLGRARKSMANMNNLLQSAGNASNLEASLYKEEQKPLDFGATVIKHLEVYSSIYPDISFDINCQKGLVILGNEPRLIQLLDKLISNAVEHCDHCAPIEVSVNQSLQQAQLIINDKGDGLPEDKKIIFDLFVSFRNPERKTDENFGLGLYIVKLIAESHGGQVTANDLNTGTGARFEVTLPLINPN